MISILSLVTSVKDYFEVVHKFIEYDSVNINYTELGSILTYFLISIKNSFIDFLSFSWLLKENILSLPIIIPEISSAMISEISVLDGYFHNAFNFLDAPVSYNMADLGSSTGSLKNGFIVCIEKLIIGMINSFFLFLPTSTAHIITLRRFVMQGLEAGYISGLGTIAGNIFWLGSVILGFRFFVIPWLSLDIFRYLLGFVLLVKYMWDSYNEKKIVSNSENVIRSGVTDTNSSKIKFFLLNFLLALTEQTSIYPFISNISISPEASILENFSLTGVQLNADGSNGLLFITIHLAYLLGLTLGSLSLLHLSCWFWENPAFKLYMWVISSFKVSTGFYYKALNFVFLYFTMLSAVCSIPYYGLDYTVTNPLGYVNDDRLIQDKVVLETSFLGTKASDRNTRRNRGRHGRRERWKRRIRKYRTFDASLYDQGIYDLFTIEDLNYGFDRFWLRRKLRNHRVRFRFFPGPWMRSFKKQLAKPRLESYTGPRVEFFRILYEQVYHPSFHAYNTTPKLQATNQTLNSNSKNILETNSIKIPSSIFLKKDPKLITSNTNSTQLLTKAQKSTIKKFIRKFDNRIKLSEVANQPKNKLYLNNNSELILNSTNLKSNMLLNNFNLNALTSQKQDKNVKNLDYLDEKQHNQKVSLNNELLNLSSDNKLNNFKKQKTNISKKELQILQYRTLLTNSALTKENQINSLENSLMLLHPLKFYLQQDTAFKRKLRYYTPSVYRKFSVENNAPYYRVMMKRYFYNYKPTLRWERTMKAASLRKARRKTTRIPRKLQKAELSNSLNLQTNSTAKNTNTALSKNKGPSPELARDGTLVTTQNQVNEFNSFIPLEKASIQKSSYNYSVVSKRASRYRYQIYKDVLQHWYYSPFNRLLLKFDVDNFIKRQPNAHFLTTKEENLLHLRRFLLFEHYNTLRWYTNMEHYRSMKTQLNGGTKSFSSRPYNQQFAGTFKKIRHLFAITPSQTSPAGSTLSLNAIDEKSTPAALDLKEKPNVLKFDQLLYNEYPNSKENPLLNSLVIHEELLPDYINEINNTSNNNSINNREPNTVLNGNKDLLSQSQDIVRKYFIETRSVREEYIKQLLSENNYSELTKFIYKGQKLRGNEPVTNQQLLNNQEKDYLLTPVEKNQIEKDLDNLKKLSINSNNNVINSNLRNNSTLFGPVYQNMSDANKNNISEQLYFTYLKNWKRRVNDQESLKNYLTRRLDKREKRKQKKEKQLLIKLNRLETLFASDSSLPINKTSSDSQNQSKTNTNLNMSSDLLTTGLQKSILDGMYTLSTIDKKGGSSNNYEPGLSKVLLLSKIKEKRDLNIVSKSFEQDSKTGVLSKQGSFGRLQDLTLRFNDLQRVQKAQLVDDIKTTVQTIQSLVKEDSSGQKLNKAQKTLYQSIKNKLNFSRSILLNNIYTAKNVFVQFSQFTLGKVKSKFYLLKPIKRKSLMDWRKKERAIGKQKRSRKEFKLLNKKVESVSSYIDNDELELALQTPSRKKRDNLSNSQETKDTGGLSEQNSISNSFKRKRSPQRRSRVRRNRGVFKKRLLTDLLRKDFALFLNEKDINTKTQYFSKFDNNLYGVSEITRQDLKESPLKQRKSKQRKERYWKQKRSKYSQKRRKYRKRRRYTIVKIRNLNKQFKRVKDQVTIQNWWWNQFIPSIQASNEALWQIERDKLIQQKLSQLTTSEILQRDNLTSSNFSSLQIGNKDFKPLSLPESIRLMESAKLTQQDQSFSLVNGNQTDNQIDKQSSALINKGDISNSSDTRFANINKLYESLFINDDNNLISNTNKFSEFLLPNTNLPFYAGWDESLRKFIVTNRMLSRKEAGFSLRENPNSAIKPMIASELEKDTNFFDQENNFSVSEFTLAPLQGMNAATTLYWQIPFTTYDPDQFFALGMDGFSPIGWRKFLFRHSILKTWLDLRFSSEKDRTQNNLRNQDSYQTEQSKHSTLVVKSRTNIISDLSSFGINSIEGITSQTFTTNQFKDHKKAFATSRRLKKRYRRVKKHPRTPVWFPSGPLSNQVLPVHYIYVFYKRSRLPRDRYLKRRLLNVKNQNNKFISEFIDINSKINTTFNYDFTLRKRLKPKRKYHLKRDYYASNVIIPRRLKFMSVNEDSSNLNMWRPLSSLKIHKPISDVVKEQQLLRRSALQKQRSLKQQPNIRVKQLRRRVQRQILRTVWRYRPRAGGFVWPGDYLKLELVKAPKLQIAQSSLPSKVNSVDKISNVKKQKRKKKRNLVEWQIQPKNYLYQKHNLKVLKKKLQKAQRSSNNSSYSTTLNVLRNAIT